LVVALAVVVVASLKLVNLSQAQPTLPPAGMPLPPMPPPLPPLILVLQEMRRVPEMAQGGLISCRWWYG
jgi:hypothetical protein